MNPFEFPPQNQNILEENPEMGQGQGMVGEELPPEDLTLEQEMAKEEEEELIPENGGYDHFENLAAKVSPTDLIKISSQLKDLIQRDHETRQEWLSNVTNRLELLNISPLKRKDVPFAGASNTQSSGLLKSWINIGAQIKMELLPADGPAKMKIVGPTDEELERIANRKKDFLNYLLTKDSSYYSEKEKCIDWAVLMGSAFSKTYFNHTKGVPESTFIMPQHLIVNANSSSLETAERITQLQKFNEFQLQNRIDAGLYLENILAPTYDDIETEFQGADSFRQTLDKMLGVQADENGKTNSSSEVKTYYIAECQFYGDIESLRVRDKEGRVIKKKLPYVITFDMESLKVAALYRNWAEDDERHLRLNHITHWKAINGLGFYGLGLIQIVGNLVDRSTKIARMFEDSGYLANTSGFIATTGVRPPDSPQDFSPTKINYLELGGAEKISDALMPLNYKEPSPSLKMLLDETEREIVEICGAAVMPFSEMSQTQPAATTFASLEQTNRIQNSIVKKFYQALKDELQIIERAVTDHLFEETYPFWVIADESGELSDDIKIGHDFNHKHIGVTPVCDPNVTSSIQRLVRAEALFTFMQSLAQAGVKVDLREGALNLFTELKVANINKLMPDPNQDTPTPLDPVTENINLMQGKGAEAAAWQDHQAHMLVHQGLLGQTPPEDPNMPLIQAHIAQHQAFLYKLQIEQMIGQQLPENLNELDEQTQNQIAMAVAQALQQQQQQQQEAGGGPIDPNQPALLMAQAEQQNAETKARELEIKSKIEIEKLENAKIKQAQDYELDSKKLELELKKHEEKLSLEDQIASLKAEIELIKANKNEFSPVKDFEENQAQNEIAQMQDQGQELSQEAGQIRDEENPYNLPFEER